MNLVTKQRIALSSYFFLSGLCFATWASRIPTIKEFFNLNEAELGKCPPATQDIDLDGNNWWNTYAGVEGTLLGYDIEQYGRRMQVRAREVIFQKTTPEDFQIPSSYTPISAGEMKAKLDEIVKDYLD